MRPRMPLPPPSASSSQHSGPTSCCSQLPHRCLSRPTWPEVLLLHSSCRCCSGPQENGAAATIASPTAAVAAATDTAAPAPETQSVMAGSSTVAGSSTAANSTAGGRESASGCRFAAPAAAAAAAAARAAAAAGKLGCSALHSAGSCAAAGVAAASPAPTACPSGEGGCSCACWATNLANVCMKEGTKHHLHIAGTDRWQSEMSARIGCEAEGAPFPLPAVPQRHPATHMSLQAAQHQGRHRPAQHQQQEGLHLEAAQAGACNRREGKSLSRPAWETTHTHNSTPLRCLLP